MRFSLIVATVGRFEPLERLLDSLAAQSHGDFEVLLVDQNPPGALDPLLASYSGAIELRHLRSAAGASRARNAGLAHVTGDVVAFPDDDCWYSRELLARIDRLLGEHRDWDGVTGTSVGPHGRKNNLRWQRRPGFVTRYHTRHQAIEYTMFLRRRVADAVGPFNVELGPGAGTPWGAGEATDYLLRALEAGFRLRYCPEVGVFHPDPPPRSDAASRPKVRSYARGGGRVLRDHGLPWWLCAWHVARPLAAGLACLLAGRTSACLTYLARAGGIVEGFAERREQSG